MSAVRIHNRARLLSAAALAVAWIAAFGMPGLADDNARGHDTKQRAAASLNLNNNAPGAAAARPSAGFMNGFVYAPGPQPGLGFQGRLKVGKTGVYVPYYGNAGTDPAHPNVEGVAGIGYGFRTWDVSVVNGGFSAGAPAAIPGGDTPKANPSLSFSIRF